MDHFPMQWGHLDAFDAYSMYPVAQRMYNGEVDVLSAGVQQQSIVTGTSVLAINFIWLDCLFQGHTSSTPRWNHLGTNTAIGAGGDMSDFQYIQALLDELMIGEFTEQDV
ncbi:hypothetical protein BDP27DRAFT_1494641 [Rhodocollybia butyracea]|uniref:Uncharacterized protein n=1 Tax=Rhodocollybia butyracea TaxID=206335 RepID=A0A9P5PAA2_9AGAR|nr:hypothetical protein BDP27DRAFT_1494641 [Rhodocollybia butyracea]